jgi:hypothetical protein
MCVALSTKTEATQAQVVIAITSYLGANVLGLIAAHKCCVVIRVLQAQYLRAVLGTGNQYLSTVLVKYPGGDLGPGVHLVKRAFDTVIGEGRLHE